MKTQVEATSGRLIRYYKRAELASTVALIAAIFFAGSLSAEELNVIVSPSNTNPTVKYYSNIAGEIHNLTVQPAAGYAFRDPPVLQLNPDGLWTHLGTGSFGLANMDGQAQHTALVHGTIVPVGGGGGGGTVTPIPFDVNMITHYFTMGFLSPDLETETVEAESELEVSVVLANAIGAPTTGMVVFSSTLGTFSGTGINVIGGMASGTLTITGTAGMQGVVVANASNVDITFGEKAAGSKSSHELEIVAEDPEPGNPSLAPIAPGKPVLTELEENTEVLVEWEDRSNNETAFYVDRSSDGSTWTRIASLPANSTSYTDTPVTPTTVYFYRIVAYNEATE